MTEKLHRQLALSLVSGCCILRPLISGRHHSFPLCQVICRLLMNSRCIIQLSGIILNLSEYLSSYNTETLHWLVTKSNIPPVWRVKRLKTFSRVFFFPFTHANLKNIYFPLYFVGVVFLSHSHTHLVIWTV